MYDGLMDLWVCIRIRMVTCLPPYVTVVVSLCLYVFMYLCICVFLSFYMMDECEDSCLPPDVTVSPPSRIQ